MKNRGWPDRRSWEMSRIFLSIIALLSLLGGKIVTPDSENPFRDDSLPEQKVENILGFENCRKCHQQQVEKLMTTAHFKSFESVHRSPMAKQYCKKLGIRSIKRDQRCVRCHYTPEKTTRGIRAQSGISCESCHGPAKTWIQGHNDYGGLTVTKAQETSEHKQQRIQSSIESGMRHPANLYLLAKSCYQCHLVDDAELINLTDHPPISEGFNMVAWSQGNMRHNFLRTDNQYNQESSVERRRVMFVVDLLAKLEAVLKALAISEPDSEHYKFMQSIYISTSKTLLKISQQISNPLVNDAIDVLKTTPPESDSKTRRQAAQKLSRLAFEFGKSEKSHLLEAIQDWLPGKEDYR